MAIPRYVKTTDAIRMALGPAVTFDDLAQLLVIRHREEYTSWTGAHSVNQWPLIGGWAVKYLLQLHFPQCEQGLIRNRIAGKDGVPGYEPTGATAPFGALAAAALEVDNGKTLHALLESWRLEIAQMCDGGHLQARLLEDESARVRFAQYCMLAGMARMATHNRSLLLEQPWCRLRSPGGEDGPQQAEQMLQSADLDFAINLSDIVRNFVLANIELFDAKNEITFLPFFRACSKRVADGSGDVVVNDTLYSTKTIARHSYNSARPEALPQHTYQLLEQVVRLVCARRTEDIRRIGWIFPVQRFRVDWELQEFIDLISPRRACSVRGLHDVVCYSIRARKPRHLNAKGEAEPASADAPPTIAHSVA